MGVGDGRAPDGGRAAVVRSALGVGLMVVVWVALGVVGVEVGLESVSDCLGQLPGSVVEGEPESQ